jgi:hypothetical protein
MRRKEGEKRKNGRQSYQKDTPCCHERTGAPVILAMNLTFFMSHCACSSLVDAGDSVCNAINNCYSTHDHDIMYETQARNTVTKENNTGTSNTVSGVQTQMIH